MSPILINRVEAGRGGFDSFFFRLTPAGLPRLDFVGTEEEQENDEDDEEEAVGTVAERGAREEDEEVGVGFTTRASLLSLSSLAVAERDDRGAEKVDAGLDMMRSDPRYTT